MRRPPSAIRQSAIRQPPRPSPRSPGVKLWSAGEQRTEFEKPGFKLFQTRSEAALSCSLSHWKGWCPGAELNHRHTDFQLPIDPCDFKHLSTDNFSNSIRFSNYPRVSGAHYVRPMFSASP
jgi:hypothetical protein